MLDQNRIICGVDMLISPSLIDHRPLLDNLLGFLEHNGGLRPVVVGISIFLLADKVVYSVNLLEPGDADRPVMTRELMEKELKALLEALRS